MHYVAFELGNVIMELDPQPFWSMVKDLGIVQEDMERILKLYIRNEFCGNVDLYDVFFDELGNDYEAQCLIDSWCSGYKLNDQMVNFVSSLKHDGFKIAYLSNVGITHSNYLNNTFPDFMNYASVHHLSCAVGAAKPSKIYYQSFLMQNEEFAGCTYLSDNQENIRAASLCKFDAIKFDLNKMKQGRPSVMKQELDRIKERLWRG